MHSICVIKWKYQLFSQNGITDILTFVQHDHNLGHFAFHGIKQL